MEYQPQEGFPDNAGEGIAVSSPEEMGENNRQQSWVPDLSEPCEGYQNKRHKSGLGGRYHLHPYPVVCFVYLAVILDVYSRKAIGYALSRNIDTKLTMDALRMAIHNRQPKPGCIHHSDRGVQYASADYVKELEFYGFQISMSRTGNPYDNAYAESFIKTLKSEEVHLWEYRTMEDVQKRISYFIDDVYNQKRLHSSLGYRPPWEFEKMLTLTHNPCEDTLIALP